MPLLDLKTDLKSLKYGQDQPGGGSSGLPYITTDINNVDNGNRTQIGRLINTLRLSKFDDGLVRGGIIGAANASITDTFRIGKFFLDTPKGPLFLIKQVGLQLSNPKLEIKQLSTDNPQSGQGFLNNVGNFITNVANRITNDVGPTRIYNPLGTNTLLQVPLNAFGGHLLRHGLLPVQTEDTKYEAVVRNNAGLISNNVNDALKNNRLLKLATTFELGASKEVKIDTTVNRVRNFLGNLATTLGINIRGLKPEQLVIAEYKGGPGSVYGILGSTTINRTLQVTNDLEKIKNAKEQSVQYAGKTRDNIGAGIPVNYTSDLGKGNNAIVNYRDGIQNYTNRNVVDTSINKNVIGAIKTYANLKTQINKTTKSKLGYRGSTPISPLFLGFNTTEEIKIIGEQLPSANSGSILYTNTYGEKVTVNLPWNKATREVRVGSGRKDQINLTPLFTAPAGKDGLKVDIPGEETKTINDLVKFRIQAIDTDTPGQGVYMVFRAYLTDLSDDVSADWQDIKYAGRGDKFYIYNGFNRKMSIGFKVAALSAAEMAPMYQKLNYLMSNLMPDYNNELMRGPLVRMTVGNYVDSQLGILTSLNYKVSQDSPWEIALNEPLTPNGTREMVLPHIIEVSLGFTPIGSQTTDENRLQEKLKPNDTVFTTTHIAQNFNGKSERSNYITSGSIKAGTILQ